MDFNTLDQKYNDLVKSMQFKGKWKVGSNTQAKLQQIGSVLDDWRSDPELHTTLGFDALKQSIGDLMPDKMDASQSKRAVDTMYNAIKQQIVSNSPKYAKVMENYSNSLAQTRAIEKELSLGDRNMDAQGLRKLQSVARNNANTSWGHRANMVQELEKYVPNIMNRIAGQSLNTMTPRGLNRAIASGTALGGAFHPEVLLSLPFQSPRLMGEAAFALGKSARAAQQAAGKISLPDIINLGVRGSLVAPPAK